MREKSDLALVVEGIMPHKAVQMVMVMVVVKVEVELAGDLVEINLYRLFQYQFSCMLYCKTF